MHYPKNSDLPESIRADLPAHAQDVYRTAFNKAWESYDEPRAVVEVEESRLAMADNAAWAAVNERFYFNELQEWVHREKKELNGRFKRAG